MSKALEQWLADNQDVADEMGLGLSTELSDINYVARDMLGKLTDPSMLDKVKVRELDADAYHTNELDHAGKKRVSSYICQLPRYYQVTWKLYQKGYHQHEVATMLNCTQGTISYRLWRVIHIIRLRTATHKISLPSFKELASMLWDEGNRFLPGQFIATEKLYKTVEMLWNGKVGIPAYTELELRQPDYSASLTKAIKRLKDAPNELQAVLKAMKRTYFVYETATCLVPAGFDEDKIESRYSKKYSKKLGDTSVRSTPDRILSILETVREQNKFVHLPQKRFI